MIEVGVNALGEWAWTLISAEGRILVYREGYPDDESAIEAAKAYRIAFWGLADWIDHRMGAAI